MATGDYSFLYNYDLPWECLQNANILITGSTGLIASNMVEALLQINCERELGLSVYALSRSREVAKARFENYLSDVALKFLEQDVVEFVNPGVSFDYIIHAASPACPDAFNAAPVDVMRANFLGTMKLLEDIAGNSHGRFMFVSSSEVYGENEDDVEMFHETDNGSVNFARFRACYPESKRAAETLCMSFAKQYGTDIVVVRPAFIFGREMPLNNTRADVYFLRQALLGEDIIMHSNGDQIRSYLYVKDCVSAMLYTLLCGESSGVYNIGDDTCVVTLRKYAQIIADTAGVKLIHQPLSGNSGNMLLKTTRCVLNVAKLRSLGWKPAYALSDGIADVLTVN